MLETSLCKQLIALVLTTKNKQTKHHKHRKDDREMKNTVLANPKKLNSSGDKIPERNISILLPLLHLTPRMKGFPCDNLRKILHCGQMIAMVQHGEEILPKISTPSRMHDITDNRWICDSKDQKPQT